MDSPNTVKRNKMVFRLFPYLKNLEEAAKLQIDDESIHYISVREYAEKISNIVKTHLNILAIPVSGAIVTDITAGVGGDTISFAMNFKYVFAIESNKTRSDYLRNNINVYKCSNVLVIHDDCNNIVGEIDNHNIIFFDPPWEPDNNSYKKHTNLQLSFGSESVETFCNKLTDEQFMKKVPELIVVKLPKNYDIVNFYKTVKHKQIYYYDLNKMIILVIIT